MTVHTFTTSTDRKRDAASLLGAYAFTGSDQTLPALMHAELRWDGETLTVAATDRYALGVFRVQLDDDAAAPVEPFAVLVHRNTVKAIAAALKASKYRIGVSVVVDADAGTLSTREVDGRQVTYLLGRDMTFPPVRQLLPTDLDGGQDEAFGMSPANLKRVAAVAYGRELVTLIPGTSPTKPVRWVSDIGYGLLMPVRLSDTATLPVWAVSGSRKEASATA